MSSRKAWYCVATVTVMSLTAAALGAVGVLPGGKWPSSWPEELEPYRQRATTVSVWTPMDYQDIYTISFTHRDDFEKIWPVVMRVKDKGAPLTLRSSDSLVSTDPADMALNPQMQQYIQQDPMLMNLNATIMGLEQQKMILGAKFGENHRVIRELDRQLEIYRREREKVFEEKEEEIRQFQINTAQTNYPIMVRIYAPQRPGRLEIKGKEVNIGAEWPPESVRNPDGSFPEYIVFSEEKWTWVPWQQGLTPHHRTRARTDIDLVVDGNIIDLNRIRLPADTPIIDKRVLESEQRSPTTQPVVK